MAEVHEDDRKLFAGGLPQEAKETDIREYFGQFGEIVNVTLKTDPMTGRSRGFCFIVYQDQAGLEAALSQSNHVVKGKKVNCKKAEAKQGKIYVGKLPPGEALSKEDMEKYFSQFGTVVEVVRPVDKMKNNEPKNFAFVTFAHEETAKNLVKQGEANINGHGVIVKKVTPKEQQGGWGGAGGYGAQAQGWGGYPDPYGYGGYGGYDPYGYGGGYGSAGGWDDGGYSRGGPAGGKMRGGAPRGVRGTRGRGRPY